MWEHYEIKTNQKGFNPHELKLARDAEVTMLKSCGDLEEVLRSDADKDPDGVWITSRWEDARKDSGELRARWVLREFATTPGDTFFFASTPSNGAIEIIHIRALDQKKNRSYTLISVVLSCTRQRRDTCTQSQQRDMDLLMLCGVVVEKSMALVMGLKLLWSGLLANFVSLECIEMKSNQHCSH